MVSDKNEILSNLFDIQRKINNIERNLWLWKIFFMYCCEISSCDLASIKYMYIYQIVYLDDIGVGFSFTLFLKFRSSLRTNQINGT